MFQTVARSLTRVRPLAALQQRIVLRTRTRNSETTSLLARRKLVIHIAIRSPRASSAVRGGGRGWTGKGGEARSGHLAAVRSLAAGEECGVFGSISPVVEWEGEGVGAAGGGPFYFVHGVEEVDFEG